MESKCAGIACRCLQWGEFLEMLGSGRRTLYCGPQESMRDNARKKWTHLDRERPCLWSGAQALRLESGDRARWGHARRAKHAEMAEDVVKHGLTKQCMGEFSSFRP